MNFVEWNQLKVEVSHAYGIMWWMSINTTEMRVLTWPNDAAWFEVPPTITVDGSK